MRCSLWRHADRVEQGRTAVLTRQVRRQQLRQQGGLRVADTGRGRLTPRQISLPHVRDRGRERLRVRLVHTVLTDFKMEV